MDKELRIIALRELTMLAKDASPRLIAPEEFEVEISRINSFDLLLFERLMGIERKFWSLQNPKLGEETTVIVPLLKLKDSKVCFIPSVVQEYLKELESE